MIPLIVAGFVLAGLFFSTSGFGLWADGSTEKSIAVLGRTGSGKSTLQAYFRGFAHDNRSTTFNGKIVNKVIITHGEKKLTLTEGLDVGGTDFIIMQFYEDQIKNNDALFFLFNSKEFIHNLDARKKDLALISFINKKRNNNQKIFIIGTFADLLVKKGGGSIEDFKHKITDIISSSLPYFDLKEVLLVDLTSQNYLQKIKEGLFKN